MAILDDFRQWLIGKGYKEYTDDGKPSTVCVYVKSIKFICKNENILLDVLIKNIDTILAKYDIDGEQEEVGQISHATVINALKRFKEFLEDQK